MNYLSVASGIEAATVAWEPLGWSPVAFAQYDPYHNYKRGPDFASAVLAHHYPRVPNWGDMEKFGDWPDADFDVLVGGTPCQTFSVAGLGAGLDDPRGELSLVYAAIARRYRPQWFAWENTPGVLSNDGGLAFASILGLMSGQRITVPAGGWKNAGVVPGYKNAYGLAWRVLDAQYVRVDGFARAVPQRRRRVFVVGYLGDWRRAAAVLFEREGLRMGHPPRRQAGQRAAAAVTASLGGISEKDDAEGRLVAGAVSAKWAKGTGGPSGDEAYNLLAVSTPQAMAFKASHYTRGKDGALSEVYPALSADADKGDQDPLVLAFQPRFARNDRGAPSEIAYPLTAEAGRTGKGDSAQCIATEWAVRRLTPTECERLQGFPDGYTDIPWRGKNWTPDSPRYRALGNSMAVNVMRWIGQRIEMVDAL